MICRFNRSLAALCAPLLAAANSCDSRPYLSWKSAFFYPFKEKLLKRYGTFKGYARQSIPKGECYACNNAWEDISEGCTHCDGTGIYKEIYYLEVYQLGIRQFLVPLPRGMFSNGRYLSPVTCNWEVPEPIVLTIEGRTEHVRVSIHDARRAIIILLLLFDLQGFLWHTRREVHNLLLKRCRVYRWLHEELFVWPWPRRTRRQTEDDGIPF